MTQCSDCGAEVPPDTPGDERQPCPNCGSLARSLAQRERELVCPDHEFNRNAGFAGVAAAVGTALLLAVIYRVRGIRHLAMELMHRITGQ